jgi:membrane protease YdiL (CAAX protease family)
MTLTPEADIKITGKLKNIATGFVFYLIWMMCVQALLSTFLETPTLIAHTTQPSIREFFFSCIVAPFWEEITFRVVPITIARILNPSLVFPVILLSSVVFALGHHWQFSLFFQGIMGFVFSVLYIKNNYCYLSAVTLHAMWNLFCMLFF